MTSLPSYDPPSLILRHIHVPSSPSIKLSFYRRKHKRYLLAVACRIDSHGQHSDAKRLLRIHLFSQSLTTIRDSHVTLTITSPRQLLRPLSTFTISTEQYSTYSKDLLTYVVHFPSRKTLAQKVSWTDVEATRDPKGERSAPTFHFSTKIPSSSQLSTPISFQVTAECSTFDLFTIVDFVLPQLRRASTIFSASLLASLPRHLRPNI